MAEQELTRENYHQHPALSVSGMRRLAVSTLRFWFGSSFNPDRVPEETPAQQIGSALHCLLLEGQEAFAVRYASELDISQHDGALDTIADLKTWLDAKQVGYKSAERKPELIAKVEAYCSNYGEHVEIIDVLKAEHAHKSAGKIMLKVQDFERVSDMYDVARNEPKLVELLATGEAEVPVLGTLEGCPVRCLLDWVDWKRNLIVDVKTFVARRDKSIERSIADAIFYEGYYLKAHVYQRLAKQYLKEHFGRDKMPRMIMVFIESEAPYDIRLLEFKSGTLYWSRAQVETQGHCHTYVMCSKQFGTQPWIAKQEIQELEDEDIRQLAFVD